ncbi:hypothetical protein ACJX0J_005214, partial (mitochondrion) [Zea mays]
MHYQSLNYKVNYTAISIQPWTHGYTKKVEVTAFLPWIGIRSNNRWFEPNFGIHKVTSLHFTSNESEFEELTDLVDEGDPPKPTSALNTEFSTLFLLVCKRVEAIGVNKSHSEMSLIHVVGIFTLHKWLEAGGKESRAGLRSHTQGQFQAE